MSWWPERWFNRMRVRVAREPNVVQLRAQSLKTDHKKLLQSALNVTDNTRNTCNNSLNMRRGTWGLVPKFQHGSLISLSTTNLGIKFRDFMTRTVFHHLWWLRFTPLAEKPGYFMAMLGDNIISSCPWSLALWHCGFKTKKSHLVVGNMEPFPALANFSIRAKGKQCTPTIFDFITIWLNSSSCCHLNSFGICGDH